MNRARQNECRVDAAVTVDGKLFHVISLRLSLSPKFGVRPKISQKVK